MWDENEGHGEDGRTALVPLTVAGERILVSVSQVGQGRTESGEEREIAGRKPKLEQIIDGVAVFAKEIAERLHDTDASKVTVEFGCDIAVESGAFIAVIGRATASSSLRVCLEWTR